jgi:hypothetical protein
MCSNPFPSKSISGSPLLTVCCLSSVLEFSLSILTASLVAFRPLIKYLPFGSHGRSSGLRGPSGGDSTRDPGTSGINDFELGCRNYVHVADPIRLGSDDGDSQRNILRDEDKVRDWKHPETTVIPKDK